MSATVRNSPLLVVASLLRDARGIAAVAAVLLGASSTLDLLPRAWVTTLLGALLLTGLLRPVLVVAFHSLAIGDGHIEARHGLVVPSVHRAQISDISAVDVTRPWHLRLFGLAHMELSVRGLPRSFVLEGVRNARLDDLEVTLGRYISEPPAPTVTPATPGSCDVFRDPAQGGSFDLGRRERIATYGGDALLVCGSFSASYEFLDDVVREMGGPLGAAHSELLQVMLLGCSLAGSVILVHLKLAGLVITSDTSGAWSVQYGRIGIRKHTIIPHEVTGVSFRIGVLDSLLGTRTTAFITASLPMSPNDPVRFPSLSLARSTQFLGSTLGENRDFTAATKPATWRLAMHVLVSIATPAATFALTRSTLGTWWAGACALAAGACYLATVRVLASDIRVTPGATTFLIHTVTLDHSYLVLRRTTLQHAAFRSLNHSDWGLLFLTAYANKRISRVMWARRSTFLEVRSYMRDQQSTEPGEWTRANHMATCENSRSCA